MWLSEVHRHENVSLLAYSPLAFGNLAGKYLRGAKPDGARLSRWPAFGQRYAKVNVPEATAAYADLARSKGLSPAALALAFCYGRWVVGGTIVGATNLDHLRGNIDALSAQLDTPTLTAIDEIHARYPNPAV